MSTSPNSARPPVRISALTHRGKEVWLVTFSFSRVLYHRCKKMHGHYSETHRGWWWPAEEMGKEELRQNLLCEKTREKSEIKESERSTPGSVISDNVMEKIREMEVWMRQKRYSESTVKTYLSFVNQFFAVRPDLSWNAVKSEDITRYNFEYFIADNKSYSSQNQWINAIKIFLKVHELNVGDLAKIERPRKAQYLPDVLTPEEVKAIFLHTVNLKHRTLLMLIYSCGLRIGETLSLKPVDIQSGEGLIYIRGGKGQKDRRVPLSTRVLTELRQYYQSYKPTEYLFEGQKGGQYSNRSAAQVLKRAVMKSGIKKRVTLHTLRHSYATHLTNKGVNIQYLQEILGHKSPKTTMLYTHLSGKDIRGIRSPLDDMDI